MLVVNLISLQMENYSNFREVLSINDFSRVRKHKQIINSVLSATTMGSLKLNDKLPSVNELSFDYNISRDTVVRAYAFLKENDIIDSVPGKGYYVKTASNGHKTKVLLLFNKLSPHMKKVYEAFSEVLQDRFVIEFCIYQDNYDQFKRQILYSNSKEYSHYVFAGDFDQLGDDCIDFIKNEVPLEKLILLNKNIFQLGKQVACICQDFETEIYLALEELNIYLKRYNAIKLIFPKSSSLPKDIKSGFEKFCYKYEYEYSIEERWNDVVIEKNTVYIDFENDKSLVKLIKKINKTEFVIGKDVGIISYDDNPLKELLLNGITVISAVFEKMGYQAADMILRKVSKQAIKPFKVIIRETL